MGNTRSSARRSIHAFSMQEESRASMYTEPLLDPQRPSDKTGKRRSSDEQRLRRKLAEMDPESYHSLPNIDLPAVIHQLNSFFAVLWPVCITIVLASLVACNATDEGLTKAMTTYMYYQDIDTSDKSLGEKSLLAFCNALVVIGVIACLTFAIVLMYKFNFTKVFFGYCVLYTTSLLGMAGAKLVVLILGEKLHWVFDSITLMFAMGNFAVVGVLSIFYQKGIPTVIEQGYLVVISVIVAWQLSQLPEWSIWMILLLLGFWDMFAVLTPMGPLRCLVNLIQEKGTPLPGLLFQADVNDAHRARKDPTIDAQAGNPPRERISESEFMLSVLSDYVPRSATSPVATRRETERFELQVRAYLRDYRSTFEHRAADLTQMYMERQVELWRRLYTFHGVQFVSPTKPYPAVYEVFSGSDQAPPTQVPHHLSVIDDHTFSSSPGSAHYEADDDEQDKSIKLGLGDFIFYSVLVARAAMYNFIAFVACFLSIIIGLAVTMQLLARFDALPALPISIFTGIAAFLVSVTIVTPYIDQLTAFGIVAV